MSKHSSNFGQPEDGPQLVPAWTAFSAEARRSNMQPNTTTVGYLPIIPESPTKLATVYELLVRSCDIASRFGQEHAIITLDQAIYSKAQEIVWKRTDQFQSVVLPLGAFHIAGAFLGVIEKRFGKAGCRIS